MANTAQAQTTAGKSHGRRWALAGAAAAVLAADQATKCLVMAHATAGNYSAAPLSIGLAANHGATMGAGAGSPLLITLAALAVAALAAAFALRAASPRQHRHDRHPRPRRLRQTQQPDKARQR